MTDAPEFEIVVPDPLFPVTFRAMSEGIYGHGVIGLTGLEATAGAGDFDVDVAAGDVQYNGSRYSHGASSTVTLDPPDADPRWDVVYFDTATETVGVKKGSAAASPLPEDIADGEVLIAYIEVDPSMAGLTNEDVRNWRSRPQPAENAPLDHANVDGQTVHEGFTWLSNNMTQSPHDNAAHDPNFSQEGHDHSGETLGETEALARLNSLVAELGELAAALDAGGNNLSNIGLLTANAATVATAPSNSTDVARKAEVDSLASTVAIETQQVATRSDLPDPTGLGSPVIAYIDEEDRYVGVYQE